MSPLRPKRAPILGRSGPRAPGPVPRLAPGQRPPAADLTDPVWLAAALAMFGVVFTTELGPVGPALMILAAGALFVLRPRRAVVGLTARLLPWIFPAFALLSAVWSPFPMATGRAAIQLAVTVATGMMIAAMLPPAAFVRALMVTELLAGIASILVGRQTVVYPTMEIASIGIFASKNFMALHLTLLMLASAAVLLDRSSGRTFRLLAVAGLTVAGLMILMAKSLGALFTGSFALAILGFIVLSRRARRRSRVAVAVVGVVATLVILGLSVAAIPPGFVGDTLTSLGKDPTLTGRTLLWDYAAGPIAENPFLGTGYYGFWQVGTAGAEYLWELMHVPSGAGFHFHNLYIHYLVDLGAIGMVLMVATVAAACAVSLRAALRRPTGAPGFFAAFAGLAALRSGFEVDFGYPFMITTLTMTAAWAYYSSPLRRSSPRIRRAGVRPPIASAVPRRAFAPHSRRRPDPHSA